MAKGYRLLTQRGFLAAAILFAVGAVLRGIPEILAGRYPVGYDTTAYYAPIIVHLEHQRVTDLVRSAPLLYLLAWTALRSTGLDVFLLLKILGVTMYAFVALTFFCFLRRSVGLPLKESFLTSLLCILQIPTLRLSWDLFRNELGIILLLASFIALDSPRKRVQNLFVVFSVLVVLAHPLVALLMFCAVTYTKLSRKSDKIGICSTAPSILLFAVWFVTNLVRYPTNGRIIPTDAYVGTTAFIQLSADPRLSSSIADISLSIVALFLFCFFPILVPAIVGFERRLRFDSIVGPMLGGISIGFFPYLPMSGTYWRWLVLLVFPFSFYALNGLRKLGILRQRKKLLLIYLAFSGLALGYACGGLAVKTTVEYSERVWPSSQIRYLAGIVGAHMPASLLQSSIGQGKVQDQIDDCIRCLEWVNLNAENGSILIVEERFRGWAILYLEERVGVVLIPDGYPMTNISVQLDCPPKYMISYKHFHLNDYVTVYEGDFFAIFRLEDACDLVRISSDGTDRSCNLLDQEQGSRFVKLSSDRM